MEMCGMGVKGIESLLKAKGPIGITGKGMDMEQKDSEWNGMKKKMGERRGVKKRAGIGGERHCFRRKGMVGWGEERPRHG